MVTINPISDTIPSKPDIVQLEVDLDPITFCPAQLNPEVERPKFFPILVAPQSIVAIESTISHSQPPKIYFGPDGEILPPGLISTE